MSVTRQVCLEVLFKRIELGVKSISTKNNFIHTYFHSYIYIYIRGYIEIECEGLVG